MPRCKPTKYEITFAPKYEITFAPTASDSDSDATPPPSPKPKAPPPPEPDPPAPEQEAAEPAKPAKKPYKFSQARKGALEKGRAKRAENLKARQEEKAKALHEAKEKKEKALADKITKELEEIQLDEGKVMKQVKRRMKSARGRGGERERQQ
jgi:hypothetical protein